MLAAWGTVVDSLGIAAAAAAVLGVLYTAWRSILNWRARRRLGTMADELLTHDDELTMVVSEIDTAFWHGVGWSGWDIWPDPLRPHLSTLNRMIDELDDLTARARAVTGSARTERLGSTIERLATVLRRAAAAYRGGTIQTYQETSGEALPPGAAARDPTPSLRDDNLRTEVVALREEASLLLRTTALQSGSEPPVVKRCASWPIVRYETRDPDPTTSDPEQ